MEESLVGSVDSRTSKGLVLSKARSVHGVAVRGSEVSACLRWLSQTKKTMFIIAYFISYYYLDTQYVRSFASL